MREIPGMVVINPCDDVEARAAVKAAYEYVGPVYLRFGRLAVPVLNDESTYKFEIGKGVKLKDGKDISIIATGLCVSEAVKAVDMLAADGIDVNSSTSTLSSLSMRISSLRQLRRQEECSQLRSTPS